MARQKGDRKPFDGYSSNEISNLKLRAPGVWKFISWALSDANQNMNIKKDVALKLLDKIAPTKLEHSGKLVGEIAYASRVFERLGIPMDMSADVTSIN